MGFFISRVLRVVSLILTVIADKQKRNRVYKECSPYCDWSHFIDLSLSVCINDDWFLSKILTSLMTIYYLSFD